MRQSFDSIDARRNSCNSRITHRALHDIIMAVYDNKSALYGDKSVTYDAIRRAHQRVSKRQQDKMK